MSSDPRDYKLDISSLAGANASLSPAGPKPFLSVLFECCGVYQRVYREPSGASYRGRCPKCARAVYFPVGPGGSAARFFRAS